MPAPDEVRFDMSPTPLQDEVVAQTVIRVDLAPIESVPPVIDNFVPPSGSRIRRNEALAFDVTDNSGSVRRSFVWVTFPSTSLTVAELAWDGTGFTPDYAALSSRTAITNGYRYSLRRAKGGWPADNVDVNVEAIDPSGTVSS